MSHYLKILLDSIFGPERFVNEIIWKRYGSHNDQGQGSRHFGRVHDSILVYTRAKGGTWNHTFAAYDPDYVKENYTLDDGDGRGMYMTKPLTAPGGAEKGNPVYDWNGHTRSWRYSHADMTKLDADNRLHYSGTGYIRQKHYLSEAKGTPAQDVWTDIKPLTGKNAERLGYPTQKPLSLLDRIIRTSTEEGDVVLDPFCGCGTTVDAAQRLKRPWIGIDITYIAVDLITKRLRHTYGDSIRSTFDINGIPSDVAGARALFAQSPFDFERWAVSLINAEPNQKQVGDKGTDGTARFPLGPKGQLGKVLVSVKGGKTLNPAMVRELSGTIDTQKAAMGVFITLTEATRGVQDAIDHGGVFTHPANGQTFARLQHFTIAELLAGKKPQMPTTVLPYIPAANIGAPTPDAGLF